MGWPERIARAEADFAAISEQLGDALYLFGDRPRLVDAAVAPILSAIAATPVATDLQAALVAEPRLLDYAQRVHTAFGKGASVTSGDG
jgi:glutathione S-transferase